MDIFGRENTGYAGAYNSARAKLSFGTPGSDVGAKMLVTNLTLNYGQQLSRIFEIGSDKMYVVVGRVQGRGTIANVIGPKMVSAAFYREIGDPCRNTVLVFKFDSQAGQTDLCPQVTATRKVTGVIAENMNMTMNAQDMMIQENVSFQFADLQASE